MHPHTDPIGALLWAALLALAGVLVVLIATHPPRGPKT